jgi:crotonobetainyl-CoA:carnitine CoA-transferase CaiB-like acyl-CoA transferase
MPPLAGDTGSFFLTFNRGKKTVELDLAQASERRALVEMVSGADVFLQNWRPGKAGAWGLEAENLAAVNPRLVYAHASGWGRRPESGRLLGTDFLVQAYTAMGQSLSPEDEDPFPSRLLLTDFMGALVTCEGVLAALYRREHTRRGVCVETSLLAGAMALQDHVLAGVESGAEIGRRRTRPLWGPLDHPLTAADGFLAVSLEGDDDLRRLEQVCGVAPGTASHDDGATIAAAIATGPVADWERALTDAGLVCGPVCTDLAQLVDDPRYGGLFEPLADESQAPASPWIGP